MSGWWRRLEAIGWLGASAATLLVACAAAYLFAILPARERLQSARVRIAQVPASTGDVAAARLEQQLTLFYRSLPADGTAVALAGKVVELAQRHGIVVRQANYRLEPERTMRLTRLLITMPLHGEYPALRGFLSDLHAALPAAAVDQVQFDRREIGERQVDARVRLVIFLERTTS